MIDGTLLRNSVWREGKHRKDETHCEFARKFDAASDASYKGKYDAAMGPLRPARPPAPQVKSRTRNVKRPTAVYLWQLSENRERLGMLRNATRQWPVK